MQPALETLSFSPNSAVLWSHVIDLLHHSRNKIVTNKLKKKNFKKKKKKIIDLRITVGHRKE